MKQIFSVSIFLLSLFFLSCKNKLGDGVAPPLFQLMDSTGIDFNNKVEDQKLDNSFLFRNFYNGGGVAIGDINNDGLADVFMTSNMGENKLYLNKGNFKFDDITAKGGFKQDSMWSTGVVFVDINNDGWLDIYVCNSGHMSNGNRRNKLYINNHDLTFTESAAKYGLDISAYTTQVSFFDYDNDGDLDCFMINNSPIPVNTLNNSNRRDLPDAQWPVKDFLKGGGDHLFRNDNGHFTEVTQKAGIHGSLISFGLGASVGDINGDGYLDIYVSNDSYERDYLYINQKNGTFKDELENCMGHTSFSSMGADLADVNNDGYPDIFTTDMLPGDDYRLKTLGAFDNIDLYNGKVKAGFYHQFMQNCLQINNKNGKFMEVANYSGVQATDWSWGALMFDADNDGFNDIYVCNGVNKDVTNLDFMDFFADDIIKKMVLTGKKDNVDEVLKHIPITPMLNKAYRNKGNLQFEDAGKVWGFTQASFSNGAAYGDLDNDGDLDLVVNNENQPAFVYKNTSRETNKNNYVSVLLKGTSTNTFAIGSSIKIYIGNQILSKEVVPSRGFQSSMDYKQVFGIGQNNTIDSMIIRWPDRSYSAYYHPTINQLYTILQDSAKKEQLANHVQAQIPALFSIIKSNFDKHQEDEYLDFYFERNIPLLLSREGPKAAVGDVNGDGLEDIYIGGAAGQPGQLYLQNANGTFTKKEEAIFQRFANYEDVAVLFFDADKDGDLDLVIGPGGNNKSSISMEMQLRLYKNDGKGNFQLDANAFPAVGVDIGTITANDFDGDGYLDLFVGARNVSREYGTTPSSYIFLNDRHGQFTDVAAAKNTDIAHVGMVTGSIWADVVGDANKELIIVGDWMTPRIFSYQHGKFTEVKTNLDKMHGWWRCVSVADVNGDGKQDLILGNIGENFYLKPNAANPVKLFIGDFDKGNPEAEKVLSRNYNGKDMPVFLKREMTDQFPILKKQNLKHGDYAIKTVQELFGKELVDKAEVKLFDYPSSIVAINNGNGQFTIQKLPLEAQLSSVNSILPIDVNNDGKVDLVVGGNEFGFQPQFSCLDASYGTVLINDGKGGFTFLDQHKSGLNLIGQVRDIVPIKTKNGPQILFLQNNDFPVLFKLGVTPKERKK